MANHLRRTPIGKLRGAAGVMALGLAALPAAAQIAVPAAASASRSDYEAAARVMPLQLNMAIRNAHPTPRWIGHSNWAWYKNETATSADYVLIDAATGHRQPAFDQAAVAAALAQDGKTVAASKLPITDLVFSEDRRAVKIATPAGVLDWNRDTNRPAKAGLAKAATDAPTESHSPDGRWAAFRRGDNLWVRNLESGAERALTSDGAAYFSYGKLPDSSLIGVKAQRTGMVLPPVGLVWSPDSKRLIIPRVDERKIVPFVYLQSVPPKGGVPIPYTLHRASIGDKEQSRTDYIVIDVATGAQRRIVLPEAVAPDLQADAAWWSGDNGTTYAVLNAMSHKTMALLAIDLATGKVREVIGETAARTNVQPNVAIYNSPNVRILGKGREALWFSERDGYGHLFLYDVATGRLKRRLTAGRSTVFDIIATDERRREVYYTASPVAGRGDPYHRILYRVSLDGGAPVRLTSETEDHLIQTAGNAVYALYFGSQAPAPAISPDFTFFVDVASTIDKPPVTVIRSTRDGHETGQVGKADISGLEALGYRPPEPFTIKAADGKTDVYGVLYWPADGKTGAPASLPIVDAIYNGPQVSSAPHTFTGAFSSAAVAPAALAKLGFAVMVLDARGTAMRDKAFHDASYGVFEDAGMDDHIAAIRELARRYPRIDATRVGVYGASFGGYYAANAVLRHPDVYKAAVAVAGPYSPQGFYSGSFESIQGLPLYSDGSHTNPGFETARNYAAMDLNRLAPRLTGKLMLAAGDMDENAPPAATYQLAEALQKANKDFDLVIMANHVHSEMWDPYVVRRMWDFFVRHLQDKQPPADFSITGITRQPY
jgi:dipeptidyl-peptidase-4